jgi:hypothetical protein
MTSTANPFAAKRSATPPNTEKPAAEKASTFSSAPGPDAGADPFDMPSGPGSGDKITDFEGHLLLVEPREIMHEMSTSIGKTDAVRADIVVLDGPDGVYESDGCLVFQQALRRDLVRIIEGPSTMLLGRLGKGEAKAGKSAPYIFEQPTDEDKAIARAYLKAKK